MMNTTTASDEYDLSDGDFDEGGIADDQHYCGKHDLFKVQNTMGDFVCVACRAEAGIYHSIHRQ